MNDEPGATILGADQLVAFEGRVYGKPGSFDAAIDQLVVFAGKSHELITALAIWDSGRLIEHTDVTTLTMRPLARDAIERYFASDRPIDCAGSYKLEERGIVLFERIETRDHTAVTGLPLIAATTILRDLGFAIP